MNKIPRSGWLTIILLLALDVALACSIVLMAAGAGPLVVLPAAGGAFVTVVLLEIACWKFLH